MYSPHHRHLPSIIVIVKKFNSLQADTQTSNLINPPLSDRRRRKKKIHLSQPTHQNPKHKTPTIKIPSQLRSHQSPTNFQPSYFHFQNSVPFRRKITRSYFTPYQYQPPIHQFTNPPTLTLTHTLTHPHII